MFYSVPDSLLEVGDLTMQRDSYPSFAQGKLSINQSSNSYQLLDREELGHHPATMKRSDCFMSSRCPGCLVSVDPSRQSIHLWE